MFEVSESGVSTEHQEASPYWWQSATKGNLDAPPPSLLRECGCVSVYMPLCVACPMLFQQSAPGLVAHSSLSEYREIEDTRNPQKDSELFSSALQETPVGS